MPNGIYIAFFLLKRYMKKQLVIAIAAGAAVLCYFVLRNKYRKTYHQPDAETEPLHDAKSKKHHLTNAFANAKKHALHTGENL